ncbi:hypothetical protein VTJ04DRAFT_10273 [Mycothermus thermophilus]|uniref:uncharacterized protein n=1 Tax=Humicola insolens TaxID=85995 RepID=UPI003743975F
MRVPALTARPLAAFSGMQRLHRPHTTNNTNLAIREVECDVGEEVCGDSYGGIGAPAGPTTTVRRGKDVAPGTMSTARTKSRHKYAGLILRLAAWAKSRCIPKGYVCCGDDGTFCKKTLACAGDGYCEYPSDDEDETTSSSSAPGTTTTSAPTTTADAGEPIPTTTASENAPTDGPSDADKAKDEDKKEGEKNSAGQMKLGAGGLMVALIAGAAMFL